MTNVCQIGFNCPFKAYSDEHDYICTHPYIPGFHEESETFTAIDEMDCPLVSANTDLDIFMCVYPSLDSGDERLMDFLRAVREVDLEESETSIRDFYRTDAKKLEGN